MVVTEDQDFGDFENLKTSSALEFLCLIFLFFLGSNHRSRTQPYTRVPQTEDKQVLESLWEGYLHSRQLIY